VLRCFREDARIILINYIPSYNSILDAALYTEWFLINYTNLS